MGKIVGVTEHKHNRLELHRFLNQRRGFQGGHRNVAITKESPNKVVRITRSHKKAAIGSHMHFETKLVLQKWL